MRIGVCAFGSTAVVVTIVWYNTERAIISTVLYK